MKIRSLISHLSLLTKLEIAMQFVPATVFANLDR